MAESFTSYTVDNDKKFREALTAAGKAVEDLRVPLTLIQKDFYKSQQAPFGLKSRGQYPDFAGPKNPKTGHTKYQDYKISKYGFDYPLLVATGVLSGSLLGPKNFGAISEVEKQRLTIGTAVKYGIYHQSNKARKKIPLRKFLFIGPEAPKFATSDQIGRLQRWTGYLLDHVASKAVGKRTK